MTARISVFHHPDQPSQPVMLSAAKHLWSGRTIQSGDEDPSLRSA
ncbi:MAG TPA: hypothetical protein VFA41_15955 [Ktedonobacteraceae bacterium]|nr:hypothetical protein [Ktedonobacteraceae bacterium]